MARLSSPAAARNIVPIGDVLADWLPPGGLVLEVASGSGEHALAFARRFAGLDWQPSDADRSALGSITAWREADGPANLLEPLELDVQRSSWPLAAADAILSINMAHISPWAAALGLLDGARRLLPAGAPLIFYGPWLVDGEAVAPSNLAFDADLRRRDPRWGLRRVGDLADAAAQRELVLVEQRAMPANNRILLLRRAEPAG